MSDTELAIEEEKPRKNSKKGLIIGLLGAILLGGGGFFATYFGMILGSGNDMKNQEIAHKESTKEVMFIELDPMIISLGKFATSRHLRFRAYLEVTPNAYDEVKHLSPRIIDVLNTYLRAIAESELEDSASMNRLRAQMLRRVQIVAGEENVKDLLITEFVLN